MNLLRLPLTCLITCHQDMIFIDNEIGLMSTKQAAQDVLIALVILVFPKTFSTCTCIP